MSGPTSNAPPVHFQPQQQVYQPQSQSLHQQDPNAHYPTPEGYVLVPISQLGSLQPQPPIHSAPVNLAYPQPPPPLPSNAQAVPPAHAQQPVTSHDAGTSPMTHTGAPALTFPTPKNLRFDLHYINAETDIFVPSFASQSDHIGYEAKYRKMDYTDRKNPHTTINDRSTNPARFAGSCIYHHYWSNNLTMNFPFLKEPWEFGDKWVSDVGTCEGRVLQWIKADDDKLFKFKHCERNSNPVFALECAETSRALVCRVTMDDMRSARIYCCVAMENQRQLDELMVIAISLMQRMRIKLVKDGKALLSDKDWDRLGKFNKVAGGAMQVAGGGGS